MHAEFTQALPDDIRNEVEAIESIIGSEIEVRDFREGDAEVRNMVLSTGLALNDIYRDGSAVTITVWYLFEKPDVRTIAHEVMHSVLRIVRQIPQLSAIGDTTLLNVATEFGNDLEHANIVAREIAMFGSVSRNYWTGDFDKQLRRCRASRSHYDMLRLYGVARAAHPHWHGFDALSALLEDCNLTARAGAVAEAFEAVARLEDRPWEESHVHAANEALRLVGLQPADFKWDFFAGPLIGRFLTVA